MRAHADMIADGRADTRLETHWTLRVIIAVFAVGIAADVLIASRLGSSGSGSILVSVALGMPIVLAAFWRILKTTRLRPVSAPLVVLTAFTAWSALSVFWCTEPEAVVNRMITNVQLLAFVWLSWQIVRSEGDLRSMLGGFLAGCTVVVASTWLAFVSGNAFEDTVFEGGTRYAAQGFDPNDMAVTLALGIPMAAYLALDGGRSRWRYLMLLYLPLAGLGITLSGSRGGLLTAGMAVACTILWLARRSRSMLLITLAVLGAGIAVILSWVPWDTWSRLLTIREQLGGSLSDREMIWRAALDLWQDHPLLGVAAGGFSRLSVSAAGMRTVWRKPPMPVVHNTPLSVGVELGAIGLLLFLGAFAIAVWGARGAPNHRMLAVSLVLTWCVGTASLSWETRKATWFVILVGAVLGQLRPRQARAERT